MVKDFLDIVLKEEKDHLDPFLSYDIARVNLRANFQDPTLYAWIYAWIQEMAFSDLTKALDCTCECCYITFHQNLLSKYDQKTKRMTLDNFIVASVQIKRLTDSFRR